MRESTSPDPQGVGARRVSVPDENCSRKSSRGAKKFRAAARDLSPFGRSDPPRPRRPPEMPKNTPLDPWGQATNARYACVVIKRAPTGRFGSKILTLICQLYVFTSTSTGRAAAVEVPNPTNLALTDGATVDFDESGVKRRSICTQQPTVPNAGGARGHLGSRRAKTRMGRHLARRPAWRSVDGRRRPVDAESDNIKKRAAG